MGRPAWLTDAAIDEAAGQLARRTTTPAAEIAARIRRDVAALGPPPSPRSQVVAEVGLTTGEVYRYRFVPSGPRSETWWARWGWGAA